MSPNTMSQILREARANPPDIIPMNNLIRFLDHFLFRLNGTPLKSFFSRICTQGYMNRGYVMIRHTGYMNSIISMARLFWSREETTLCLMSVPKAS